MPQSRPTQNFTNGVLTSTTPFTVDDIQLRAEAAETRLRTGRARLRQIRTQSQAAADAGLALSLLQQLRLCQAVADMAQTLMDLELLFAVQADDGAD